MPYCKERLECKHFDSAGCDASVGTGCFEDRPPQSGKSGLVTGYNWKKPEADAPEGDLLVLVKTNKGVEKALVFVDEDGQTLRELEYGDVWTSWQWEDVTAYMHLDDILPEL